MILYSTTSTSSPKSIVVISPPGGVGEVTVVKAASMGAAVKWFIVSSPSPSATDSNDMTTSSSSTSSSSSAAVVFSQDALMDIQSAGGSVELAGADANVLLQKEQGALNAVGTWCQTHSDGLVCCMDGTENVVVVEETDSKANIMAMWNNAIKVAAKEASKGIRGCKLAIISELGEDDEDEEDQEDRQPQLGGGLLDGLFGGKDTVAVPKSISSAIKATAKLRHGTLFGIPESSPSFSILLGGPQKNAILCEEYQMRNVRLDPSSTGLRKETQSSRHVVGEAAALMVTNGVPVPQDVSITSLVGMEKFDLWGEEFDRVATMERQGQGAVLFTTAFSSVPSIDRLSSWIATKWAPAVMRTYDIAAIRTGSRPVYANQIEEDLVEIVWQELVNFESVTIGKLLIRIANEGITATRGPGDASKGFGSISRKPFNGEAVLIQRLADAASQATEKGLANKPAAAATAFRKVTPPKPEPTVVSSLQSAVTVTPVAVDDSSGPRQSGAKRSSEKARGKRTRRISSEGIDTTFDDDSDESGVFE